MTQFENLYLSNPVFFPSVSSVSKTKWDVYEFVQFLIASKYPQFLVSCYDLFYYSDKEKILHILNEAKDQKQFILLDSGIYEEVWHKTNNWNKTSFHEILSTNFFSEAFCYDSYFLDGKIITSRDINESVTNSIVKLGIKNISPIIHNNDGDNLAENIIDVLNTLSPSIIAFPERELGKGVYEIAKNIFKIRKIVNTINPKQIIHILGTGNPISIMLYYYAGANSFDGLDWCQTVVDFDTAKLHHYQHLDLYKHQSEYGNYLGLTFLTRCYLHNLEFYDKWLIELGKIKTNSEKSALFDRYLPNEESKIAFCELLCK